MAGSIGVVSKVIGQVFAVASDGARRLLVEGDRLFAGEQLDTGLGGAVAVRLANGAELTLGRGSSLTLTPDLLANHAPHVQAPDPTPTQAQLSDVERLQQAIAAGGDPTQEGEAPAAGPGANGAPGALGGGHSFVLLTEVAGRVDPTVGFPTAGFNGTPELANRDLGGLDPSGNPPGAGPATNPPHQSATCHAACDSTGHSTCYTAGDASGESACHSAGYAPRPPCHPGRSRPESRRAELERSQSATRLGAQSPGPDANRQFHRGRARRAVQSQRRWHQRGHRRRGDRCRPVDHHRPWQPADHYRL